MPGEVSIEPSYDMVRAMVEEVGFRFVKEETGVEATYSQNPNSMLQYRYKCVFFHCEKI